MSDTECLLVLGVRVSHGPSKRIGRPTSASRRFTGLRPAAGIIRSRFEEYAGSGYPRQLAGDEIPLASRVLAVADSYDAMRSPRPFRDAMTHEQAIGELVRGSGTPV